MSHGSGYNIYYILSLILHCIIYGSYDLKVRQVPHKKVALDLKTYNEYSRILKLADIHEYLHNIKV